MNEEMLSGLDGPRPLPPALRQQLEDRLLSDASRPLEPELAGRLASALGAEPSGARLPRFTRARMGAAAAAAGLLIAGGVTVSLDHPGRARPAAVSSSSTSPSRLTPAAPVPSAAGAASASPGAPSLNASNAQLNQSSAASGSAAPSAPAGPLYGVAATLTPDSGPAAGGTWVTITGPHLSGATGVRFGSRLAPRYTVVSDDQIRALTPPAPPGPAGPVPVTVLPAPGESSLGPFPSFTYTPPA